MLTKEELGHLREQITLNSLFLSDYENDIGIDPVQVSNFFDSFVDYLGEKVTEVYGIVNDRVWYGLVQQFDRLDVLYSFYQMYEDDPLVREEVCEYVA